MKIVEKTSYLVTETRQFVWSGNQRDEERNAAGSLVKRFFVLGQTVNSSIHFYVRDQLGSTREIIESGNIIGRYAYNPFGEVTDIQGSNVAEVQFGGYYRHMRSGLCLARTRAYASNLGRWLNRDPIEEDGGMNLYSYVGSNPINWSDPSGLCANTDIEKLRRCLDDCLRKMRRELNAFPELDFAENLDFNLDLENLFRNFMESLGYPLPKSFIGKGTVAGATTGLTSPGSWAMHEIFGNTRIGAGGRQSHLWAPSGLTGPGARAKTGQVGTFLGRWLTWLMIAEYWAKVATVWENFQKCKEECNKRYGCDSSCKK